MVVRPLLAHLRVNKGDLLTFVLFFGRFEYALKRARFVIGGPSSVQANWDEFGRLLEPHVTVSDSSPFEAALAYLDANRPGNKS